MTTFVFLLLLRFISLSSSDPDDAVTTNHHIYNACKATRHPAPCESMLKQSGRVVPNPSAKDIIRAVLHLSEDKLITGRAMVQEILDTSAQNPNRTKMAEACLEGLEYSAVRARATLGALSRDRLRDARAWGSSALSLQHGCWGGFKPLNDTPLVHQMLTYFAEELIVSTSNALSMLRAFDALGDNTTNWAPPLTERDGFWEPVVGLRSGQMAFKLELGGMKENVTVCKSGCDHWWVQEAVDAAPEYLEGEQRYVIKIKEGVYEEIVRVPFTKNNLVLFGDGIGKTVITGSLNAGLQGISTFYTATVGVLGDGFMASGITFQNTAGPGAAQAVAFRSDSDFSYIENCEFLGNQDTLYAHSLRQLYNNCHIEGTIDFIFGVAAAIFQNCTILFRPRQENPEKGGTYVITAHGRFDPAQTAGFAFLGCLINGTDEFVKMYETKPSAHKSFLGRPWKQFSRTVFINCTMEGLINPEGWMPWQGDVGLSTAYDGEYGNTGQGADRSKRVPWSSSIPAEHVSTYNVQNFLQGDEWIGNAAS